MYKELQIVEVEEHKESRLEILTELIIYQKLDNKIDLVIEKLRKKIRKAG